MSGLSCSRQDLGCSVQTLWSSVFWLQSERSQWLQLVGLSALGGVGSQLSCIGIEAIAKWIASPALQGGFLTTEPPGKSLIFIWSSTFSNQGKTSKQLGSLEIFSQVITNIKLYKLMARDHSKIQNKTLNSLVYSISLKWMEFKIVSYLRTFKIYSLHD